MDVCFQCVIGVKSALKHHLGSSHRNQFFDLPENFIDGQFIRFTGICPGMKCAESTGCLTNIGKVHNPIDDESHRFFGECQFSSHITGFSQIDDVPGK